MRIKSVYFVGIKGVAMTAMAVYLQQMGVKVSGSDVKDNFPTGEVLNQNHIPVFSGFKANNLPKYVDLVIVTGAHGGMTNIEAIEGQRRGFRVVMQGKAIGEFSAEKDLISVAGCHGKTTTSAMIAFLLTKANYKPSYLVGTANINNLGAGGHYGKGKYFVAEADEYVTCPLTDQTPRFLWQNPKIAVITNIEYDHPDVYPNLRAVEAVYQQFIEKIGKDGTIIAGIDNLSVQKEIRRKSRRTVTYGFSPQADFQISKTHVSLGMSFFWVKAHHLDLGEFMLRIPGRHNLLNALASGIAANMIGINWSEIKKTIKDFTGTKRRLEKIAEIKGISLYDDYAHHPTEIKSTLEGIREWYPEKRIILVFQPHTYSRTKNLLTEFSRSLNQADVAIVTDIYPSAREKEDKSINSGMMVREANRFKNNALYLKNKIEVANFLKDNLRHNDLVVTMGAGDVYTWNQDFIRLLNSL